MRRTSLLATTLLTLVVWALAASAPVATAMNFTYNPPTNIGVGVDPNTVAVGEFDNNSHPDIVTVNETSNNISVLLGGDGSPGRPIGGFTAAPSGPFGVGSLPDAIAQADFNGDSETDLVVANQNSDNVSVLFGVGNGSFTGTTHLSTVPPSTAINNPPGGITAVDTVIPVDDTSNFPTSGLARIDNEVIQYTGKTGTSFTGVTRGASGTTAAIHADNAVVSQIAGDGPTGVAVADFDGDSYLDLVVTNENSDSVSVLRGRSPRGTFHPATSFPTGVVPQGVVVGHFNGDSNPDLAVINEAPNATGSGSVKIYVGAGDGTFTQSQDFPFPSRRPASIALGDFNGDSRPDFAVGNFNTNNVSIFLGAGNGTFTRPPDVPLPAGSNKPVALEVGHFNGDSNLDLVVVNESSMDVNVMLGAGNGAFPVSATFVLPTVNLSPQMVAVGNLNADTYLDIVVADKLVNRIALLFALEPQTTITTGPPALSTDRTPTFEFSSNDPTSTFQCKVDGGSFHACSSPYTTAQFPLDDGTTTRTFQVRAIDNADHVDSTPATWSFNIDNVPPPTPSLTGTQPASPANDNNPAVKGTAAAGSTVTLYTAAGCSGSAAASGSATDFSSSGIPVGVPDNSTTKFYATASDQAGNVSGCSTTSVTYVEETPPPPPDPDPPTGGGPPGPGGPVGAGPGDPIKVDVTAPAMGVAGKTVKLQKKGTLSLVLSCPSSEPGGCLGSLSLETAAQVRAVKKKVKLGKSNFHVGGGKSATIRLRLSKKNLSLVKKLRKVRVRVLVSARDQVGNAAKSQAILILKA